MKIIALIENQSNDKLLKEHGLCVYIEYNGISYLLDTGGSGKFLKNADKLGVSIENIDIAVLSHEHCDHSGGYAAFFKKNNRAKVYLRGIGDTPYYYKVGPIHFYVGMPRNIMKEYPDKFINVQGTFKLNEGVWLISHNTPNLEKIGQRSHLYRKITNGYEPDNFSHEQSLVFDTEKGLIVLNSCSHSGICNIIKEVKKALNGKNVYAVIGGFHLMGNLGTSSCAYSKEEVIHIVKELEKQGVQQIYTGHCTGKPAFNIMKSASKGIVNYFSTGTTLEI